MLSDEDSTFLFPKQQLELKIVSLNDTEMAGAENKQQEQQYLKCSHDMPKLSN